MPDPRLAVTIQLAWNRPNISGLPDCTHNAFPEPDNYTHAIWYKHPLFIEGIEHQCWYRDRSRGGWMSLYVVRDLEYPAFEVFTQQTAIWGIWTNEFVKAPRRRLPWIEAEKHIKWGDHHGDALDETLYKQGFYDGLIYKGAELKFIEHYAGSVPRDEPA